MNTYSTKELMEEKPLTLEEKAKMYDELVSAGEALIKNGINPPFAVYLKGREKPLIHRFTRHVEMEKARVIIGPEAIKVLDLNKNNNEVIVTVYDDKVVITKKE